MVENKQRIEEDEIDLKELFLTLWAKKVFIVGFTLVITIGALIYISFKNPTPIYSGKVLIEMGEVQSETFGIQYLDNPNNLIPILQTQKINANTPRGTNKLLELSYDSINQENIRQKLQQSVEYILQRHQEKAKFYENVIMTQQIGEVQLLSEPINKPKKKLIVAVAFVTGFILAVFLVFFMQFIKGFKEEKETIK